MVTLVSTKTECDYLYGGTKKPNQTKPNQTKTKQTVTYATISPKMVNPRDTSWERRRRRKVLWWIPCQTPAVIRSALGMADPVPAYCNWDLNVDLQILFQCSSTYNCLRRSVPEIHTACCSGVQRSTRNNNTVQQAPSIKGKCTGKRRGFSQLALPIVCSFVWITFPVGVNSTTGSCFGC